MKGPSQVPPPPSEAADVDTAAESGTDAVIGALLDEGLSGFATGSARRKLSRNTITMAIAVALAVGSLVSMKLLSRAAASPSGNRQAEERVRDRLKLGDEPTIDLSNAIALDRSVKAEPIPASDVQKNPFIIGTVGPREPEVPKKTGLGNELTDAEKAAEELRRRRDSWLELATSEASSLQLKSTLAGAKPLANISGQIVSVGDVIGEGKLKVLFKVTGVRVDEVDLEATDRELDTVQLFTLIVDRKW